MWKSEKEKKRWQHIIINIIYLCSLSTNHIKRSDCAVEETDDLLKVVISDAPWAIHQEDKVCFGSSANWDGGGSGGGGEGDRGRKSLFSLSNCFAQAGAD